MLTHVMNVPRLHLLAFHDFYVLVSMLWIIFVQLDRPMSNSATLSVTGQDLNAKASEIKEAEDETPQQLAEWTLEDVY